MDYHLKEAKFNYPLYSDDPLWFHETSKHTEDFPISEYTKETKKIVFWTKDFAGRLGYTNFITNTWGIYIDSAIIIVPSGAQKMERNGLKKTAAPSGNARS